MYGSEGLRDMREYLVELSYPTVMRNGDGKLGYLEMLFHLRALYSAKLCSM